MCRNQKNEQKIKELFGAESLEVRSFDVLDSTNNYAKNAAITEQPRHCLLVTADEQTSGKGRCGHSFFSPKDGIYMSLLLPVGDLQAALTVTSLSAVAVMEAIREVLEKQTEIKWVNDLYYQGKKICGILCESVTVEKQNYVIVGIGINLCPQNFPKDIASIAGSVGDDASKKYDIICKVVKNIQKYIKNVEWVEKYRNHSMVLGKEIKFFTDSAESQGVALRIEDDGGLTVGLSDGKTITLRSGEIHLRLVEF